MSASRHPAFTSGLAARLIAGLSWRQLRDVWDATSEVLDRPIDDETRLAQAMLRDELLREMEALDPDRFSTWYLGLHRNLRRRDRR